MNLNTQSITCKVLTVYLSQDYLVAYRRLQTLKIDSEIFTNHMLRKLKSQIFSFRLNNCCFLVLLIPYSVTIVVVADTS